MIDQFLLLVRQLTISQRIGIVFGAVLTVLMTVGLVMWAGQPQMQAAFTNVATSDAATITGALTSAGIAYTLDNGGSTISVPASKVAEARIAADQAGYAGAGASGFDIFNQQQLGASSFDQQVQLQRAIQNQDAQTIKRFDGVADASVTIVFAKTGVTTSTDQPASASVWVKMAGGAEPSADLVGAIVSSVAASVPSLDPSNVAVVDAQGHTLSGPNGDASTAQSLQAGVERSVRAKLQSLLDSVLGPNTSAVQVTARLDMSRVSQTTTTVVPIDTLHWTPTGVQTSTETYSGTGANGAGGIAGTTSNVPGLPTYPNVPIASSSPAPSAGASASPGASAAPSSTPGAYLKQTETVNYANSTDVKTVSTPAGSNGTLSGAVYVDSQALQKAGFKDAAALETTIEAAVGAPQGSISTTAVTLLGASAAATTLPAPGPLDMLPGILPTVGGALLALALVFLVWRNMRALRGRAEEMQLAAARLSMPALAMGEMGTTTTREAPLGAAGFREEDLPRLAESPQSRIGERLRQFAEQEPDEVANLVRTMLDEDERVTRRGR